MTGQEAVALIHSMAWTGRKPGLSRTLTLLHRLGDPQEKLKFVHITGTNGKGSTAAMTAAILYHAGLKTGLYTSPHLWRFHERFQVNGIPIPDAALGRIAGRVLEAAQDMEDSPTEFELMTAVGMLYFLECRCDLVVVEVGLGGRLDSTNVIPSPEVAAITNIGLEHTKELGNTRAEIAEEKAGIIKPGCSVVLYHQSEEVEGTVRAACVREGVPLRITAPDTLELLRADLDGQIFRYRGTGPFQIHLLGAYQLDNAAVALDIAALLRERGWMISDAALRTGLEAAVWPARMELVRRKPDLILDGGHNPQCMEAIRRSLEQLYPGQRIWFLTGVLADKDYPAMYRSLLPVAKGFVTVTPDSPRALPSEELAQYLQTQGATAVPAWQIEDGLRKVMELAGENEAICVCGSLYMIGEIRHQLGLC